MKRSILAVFVTVAVGCGSSAAAPASTASSNTGPAGNGGPAGASAPSTAAGSGGAGNAGSGNAAAAGASGAAGSAGASGMLGAAVCKIPNDIPITMEDGDDAGVAPDCQNVPRKIIAENCIGGYCHDNVGPPAGGLDLMSPCVADRLVGVHSSCMDFLLIDPTSLDRSFIHDKVTSQYPKCGKSMPDGGHLPPDQVRCMNAWITAVIRAANSKQ